MIGAAQLALSLALLLAGPGPVRPGALPVRAAAVPAPRAALPGAVAFAPPGRVDPWFGDDKLRHLTMSFASTMFAFAGARSVGLGQAAEPAAAGAAIAAGIGKELYDARSGRFFSVRDLAWDLAGVLAGYAVAQATR